MTDYKCSTSAYYPTHHFEHVIDSLVKVIEEHGGEVIYRKKVTDFLLEDKQVVGVKTMDMDDRGQYPVNKAAQAKNDSFLGGRRKSGH
jgi:phytoene dehydrogenase-like protein